MPYFMKIRSVFLSGWTRGRHGNTKAREHIRKESNSATYQNEDVLDKSIFVYVSWQHLQADGYQIIRVKSFSNI
jgi:hypothetical protein